jgi:VanZ family protein
MMKYCYRILTAVLLAGWMILIFQFSAQPAEQSELTSGAVSYRVVSAVDRCFQLGWEEEQKMAYAKTLDHPIRKAAHMTEYAILGCIFELFFAGFPALGKKVWTLSLLATALYAASDEIHQLFVPGRAGQFRDVCIDTAGALIGLLLLYFIKKNRKHCEKNRIPLQ